MLDLKAKLAAAGLVSEEELARANEPKGRTKPRAKPGTDARTGTRSSRRAGLDVDALRSRPKSEQYDAVRRLVETVRLDPIGRMPSDRARSFHFATEQGQVGRLVIEPHVVDAIGRGAAEIVAFMSHHGLAHAVVPIDDARRIGELFPAWRKNTAAR